MNKWLSELCGENFMPHGQCYLWDPTLIWLHVIADSLIALAYYSIPLVMLYFVRKRRDLPFPTIFVMFGAFIIACGTTHLMEVWTVWQPHYVLSGGIKLATAIISLVTAVALVRVVPFALALPSPADLRKLNEDLENRVAARTADLTTANDQLRREIQQRELAEAEVRRLNIALEQRVSELQTLFDLMPVGVGIATDATCTHIKTNRAFAQILGLPAHANASLSAPPDQTPSFHITKDGLPLKPAELPMQRATRENTALRDFEETIVRADGAKTDVLVSAVPIRDEAGQPRGCVATFQDITAHKHAAQERLEFERRLRESQKVESIAVLAGGIAHDFNNLLTSILGYTTLVRLNLPPDAPSYRMLESAENSAHRAAELCKQLLAYAGKGSYHLRSISLNDLIGKSLPLLKLPLGPATTLQFDLDPQLPTCRGDTTQLRQVITSIITNSAEAIGESKGNITLRSSVTRVLAADLALLVPGHHLPVGECVCLEIIDDGSGMDPATLARAFEPFFTTRFIGRGLGLPAVLGVVHGHGGGMRMTSEPGRGTVVRIYFPVEAAVELTSTGSSMPTIPSPRRRGRSVLVVDDEPTVRKFAAEILTDAGYKVLTVNDGQEAIDLLRSRTQAFDVVLLDLTMPRLDGESTLIAIRFVDPTLPVILMSGHSERLVAERFVGRGVSDFLAKPFSAVDLATRIRSTIAKANPNQPTE